MVEQFKCSLASILIVLSFGSLQATAQTQITFLQTGAPEYFVVPPGVTSLAVECYGAEGGKSCPPTNVIGGKGSYNSGVFSVSGGDTLIIIVGQKGKNGVGAGTNYAGGGGGGSFVIQNSGNIPLIIAAGGGGGSFQPIGVGEDGSADVNAGAGTYVSASPGEGGFTDNGNGGGTGGGGSGWNSDGTGNNWCTPAILQGGTGGVSFAGPNPGGDGGFGGGGAGYNGGGGGGGYTGGGGGGWPVGGGGGGSYNIGVNQVNTAGVNLEDGQVIITTNCDQMSVTSSASEICFGDQVTLTATSPNGGTISWNSGVIDGVPFTPVSTGLNTYIASSTDTADCAFTVDVFVNALPNVIASADTLEFCHGTNQEVIFTGSGANSYVWDNGVVNGVPYLPSAGITTYSVIGTDTLGCQNSNTIVIHASDPSISFVVTDEIAGNDGTVDLTVTGGIAPFEYDWNNDGTGDWDDTEDLTGLVSGIYFVNVRDVLGCSIFGSATVNSSLAYEDFLLDNVALYPNPAHDFIYVELQNDFSYWVADLQGRIVIQGVANGQEYIDITSLQKAHYVLLIKQNDIIGSLNFIKE